MTNLNDFFGFLCVPPYELWKKMYFVDKNLKKIIKVYQDKFFEKFLIKNSAFLDFKIQNFFSSLETQYGFNFSCHLIIHFFSTRVSFVRILGVLRDGLK